MDQLTLETAEEVFGYGVVMGIAFAGHTLQNAEVGVTLTVSTSGVWLVKGEVTRLVWQVP